MRGRCGGQESGGQKGEEEREGARTPAGSPVWGASPPRTPPRGLGSKARPSRWRPWGTRRLSSRLARTGGASLPARTSPGNQKPGTSVPAPLPSPPPPTSGDFLGNAATRWSGLPRKFPRALSRARPGSSREFLRARGARGSQRSVRHSTATRCGPALGSSLECAGVL